MPGVSSCIAQRKLSVAGGKDRGFQMLDYAVVFFVVAVIAAIFGFSGIAAGAAEIAKVLFVVFLILFVASLAAGMFRRRS